MHNSEIVQSNLQNVTSASRIWIDKLALTDFRNYSAATLAPGPAPIVLAGPNGAGKTNCLEAVSLLTAGRGLRSLPFSEFVRSGGSGAWAIAARVNAGSKEIQIGTGIQIPETGLVTARSPRIVKIDNEIAKGSGALARIRMLWLTPAMDSLFTGPASERRRFIDRLVLGLDPAYATAASTFDRAMRQRNKGLEDGADAKLLKAIETQMATAAVTIAIARCQAIASLVSEIIEERDRAPDSVFPWAVLSLSGHLEEQVASLSGGEICAGYERLLAQTRERDRAAKRTLVGPHRSDLAVAHGSKGLQARMCSTGEQKALLIGLVLAQARLIKKVSEGVAPLVLLDEVAAHLDIERRLALFTAIANLDAQVWMTGTDIDIFDPLRGLTSAQFFRVCNGGFARVGDAESHFNS